MPNLPAPRTPDPSDAPAIRWGIVGPGGIARTFTEAVHARTAGRVVAVGSRDARRAHEFAERHGVERAHGSCAELVADDGVDAVYVASPHSAHHEHALLALAAGKPVLVEKAFTRNAAEAREVVDAARAAGLAAMEAMWTRFLPHVDVVRQCLESGALGDVVAVEADHGQQLFPHGPQRLADPELAGGALLDLGVYPVSFAHLVLGDVDTVSATGMLTDTGVDGSETVALRNADGVVATLSATMRAFTPCRATVAGTRARLDVDGWFYQPNTVRLFGSDGVEQDRYEPADRTHGLAYQAAEFARLLADGRTESELLPLEETVAVMTVLDEARAQLGVVYPGERS